MKKVIALLSLIVLMMLSLGGCDEVDVNSNLENIYNQVDENGNLHIKAGEDKSGIEFSWKIKYPEMPDELIDDGTGPSMEEMLKYYSTPLEEALKIKFWKKDSEGKKYLYFNESSNSFWLDKEEHTVDVSELSYKANDYLTIAFYHWYGDGLSIDDARTYNLSQRNEISFTIGIEVVDERWTNEVNTVVIDF